MQFDMVAIGGGFSGLVPACRVADLGLSAAVLEARSEDLYPCSSRYSTGVAHVMSLPILSEPDRLYRAIMDGSGANARPALARAIADHGKRAIDWLTQQGAQFTSIAMERERSGARVLAPNRRSVAGLDWEGRGPDLLMRRLETNLTQRGGVLLRGTKVEALVVEGGACVGVDAVRDGARQRIAAKAVVIADSGFAANRDMIAKYITPRADRVLCRACGGSCDAGSSNASSHGSNGNAASSCAGSFIQRTSSASSSSPASLFCSDDFEIGSRHYLSDARKSPIAIFKAGTLSTAMTGSIFR